MKQSLIRSGRLVRTPSSNVSAPDSASADEQRVRQRRAAGGSSSPDSASVAQPVSDPGASGLGRQEEDHAGAAQALR
ncbi:hypothetical protein GGR52DRAFT_571584 [Hypoxylon sp. FL1284]|nr:hypothetical protein GGR52DRAFT_571584 [Hypoxylon sp. FL1284]